MMREIGRRISRWNIWILILLAVAAIWTVSAWWPRAKVRRDAAMPARPFPPEMLGPSPAEVIRRMNEKGFTSPKDVIED